jgi:hygromycin-B 4-O-kinase
LTIKKHPVKMVREKTKLAKEVIKHHFGIHPTGIIFKPAGHTNFVFEATARNKSYIVRIATKRSRLNDFIKEQWAVEHAQKKGVPVAEILEVGCDVIGLPYMLQKKLNGEEAVHHPERFRILQELGKFARIIHSIPTTHFGNEFDWNRNKLSKNQTWKSFLHEEWKIRHRLNVLEKYGLMKSSQLKKLNALVSRMENWEEKPTLSHGDLRLKNVIVNRKGKFIGLIDWENCISTIAPYWDLSIALHDLSIDAKMQFLKGYGTRPGEMKRLSPFLKAINVLNYAPIIESLVKDKKKETLAFHQLRLQGAFDLFLA